MIKDYLISVTAAALICGMINSLSGKSSISKLMKLLCGIFLASVVIRPVVDIKIGDILDFTDNLAVSSDIAVSAGEKMAAEEMEKIIKTKTEAYILDKAKNIGAEISAEISLNDLVPTGITVVGNLSPYARSSLAAIITNELNIPPEAQIWKSS